jgi:hypothetical protein
MKNLIIPKFILLVSIIFLITVSLLIYFLYKLYNSITYFTMVTTLINYKE